MHAIAHILGLTDASGPWYLWWSGIAGDLGMLGGVVVLWRRVACHADGCHRLGLHHVKNTRFVTCRRHHPSGGNSVEDIHKAGSSSV